MNNYFKAYRQLFLILLIMSIFSVSTYARSGCCSNNGGVAYCDNTVGKYACRDGTRSPTCGCGSGEISKPRWPASYKSYDSVGGSKDSNTQGSLGDSKYWTEIDKLKAEITLLKYEIKELKEEVKGLKIR